METATQTLHRLTSIEAGREWTELADDPRIVRDFEVMDVERFPWFFKRYAQSLPRVALPRTLPRTTAPAVAVLAGSAEVASNELDLAHLSRLLYRSAGVVRTTEGPHRTFRFRAAGSAGGPLPPRAVRGGSRRATCACGGVVVRPARPRDGDAARLTAPRRRVTIS